MSTSGTALVFFCDGGSQADPQVQPVLPGTAWLRVPCVGRVSEGDVLRALRRGARAVILAGCAPGTCRFHMGQDRAGEVVARVRRLLSRLGIPEAVVDHLAAGSAAEAVLAVGHWLVRAPAWPGLHAAPWTERALPARSMFPHHGALQEAALVGCLAHSRPLEPPAWADPSEGPGGEGTDLLFSCDLPAVEELLGEPFGVTGPGVRQAALSLARAAGLRPVLAEALCSCGHDFRFIGDHQALRAMAPLTRASLALPGITRLVALCPECGETLRESYPRLGAGLGFPVEDLADVLYARRHDLRFRAEASPDPVALYVDPDARTGERMEIAGALLEAARIPVVARLPLVKDDRGLQGSAGVSGFVACDGVARMAQERLLGQAAEAGAKSLVCASPMASVHLGCALRRGAWRRHRLEVTSLFVALADRLVPAVAPASKRPSGLG